VILKNHARKHLVLPGLPQHGSARRIRAHPTDSCLVNPCIATQQECLSALFFLSLQAHHAFTLSLLLFFKRTRQQAAASSATYNTIPDFLYGLSLSLAASTPLLNASKGLEAAGLTQTRVFAASTVGFVLLFGFIRLIFLPLLLLTYHKQQQQRPDVMTPIKKGCIAANVVFFLLNAYWFRAAARWPNKRL
jgi:hypothetical protein